MKPFHSSFSTIIEINIKLLLASSIAFIAWLIWPDSMDGWGWGYLSIMMGFSATGVFIGAVQAIIKLYTHDKVIAEYMAQGNKPKFSNLASRDDLNDAGM